MTTHKKLTALLLVTTFAVAFAIGYSFHSPDAGHRDARYSANVYVIYETMAGREESPAGNVITNIGERYVRNLLGWNNVTNNNGTQWISLGNASAAAALTKLTTEATSDGFTRAANDTCVAWNNGTDYAYNVSKKFTATGAIQVNCTGLHWNPTSDSDNNLFACADITETAFAANDNCTIKWVITVDGN